ncbi:MFS transporter [Alkalihalobacillus trypoxylicola]|uniref:Major facilitator superfamily (MFS) profile domain-containing protein n=1 Tax=Alkalihalobacillus trypoxylicola TaxID=519424 RepID=A0A162CWU9_9BACI|nr:MFS transporter [Alkalihalobacillus trypoxylicola]KYG26964.1 hypothetical protein AZF04_11520 [Alkalihalobacillus trypoxylicola]
MGYEMLKKEKNYKLLFWSDFSYGIGSRFSQVGSFALLYQLTESGIALGILLALRVMPTIVFAPLSGYLADRFHRANILYRTHIIQAPFVCLPIAAAFWEQSLFLYISTFIVASGDAIKTPVRYALIPDIVQRKHLIKINGLEQNIVGITLIFGSLLGGVIAFLFNTEILFVTHTLLLILTASLIKPLLSIKLPSINKQSKEPLIDHLKLIFNVSILRAFLFVMLTMPLANGIDNVIFNLIALEVFEKGDLGVGLIYASLGLGFVLSSFMTKWIRSQFLTIGIGMIALEGIGHLFLSQSLLFIHALFLAIFITFVGGISNICFDTVLMKILPASKRGSLFGILSMFQNSSMGIAMIIAGFITEVISPLQSAFYIGLLYLFFALLYGLIFKRLSIKKSMFVLRKKMS